MMGLMVAMGIGRFAFTPILPLMQRDLGMTHAVAGGLASLNYLGYLAGAVCCSLFPGMLRNTALNIGALAATLATTALMGLTLSPFWWGLFRFVGGGASAVLFVVISAEVAEALVRHGYSRWSGTLFAGVGLGIAVSGIAVPLLDSIGGWRGSWLGLGLIALILAVAGILLADKRQANLAGATAQTAAKGSLQGIGRLAAAYFFEGLGYIVSATFLVAMIARTPGLERFAPWSWVAVGVAAVPSTVLWQMVARRFCMRTALLLAYAVQIAGVLLSIIAADIWTAGIASVCFGGTFLGIVGLVMAEGNRRARAEWHRVAALLTACFGAGQVIGPPLAGVVADGRGGFTIPLLLAAAMLCLGAGLIATDRNFKKHF